MLFPDKPTFYGALGGDFYTYHDAAGSSPDASCYDWMFHKTVATLESIPILGTLIALVEYGVAIAFLCLKYCYCKDEPAPPPAPLPPAIPVAPLIPYAPGAILDQSPIPSSFRELIPLRSLRPLRLDLPVVIVKIVREYYGKDEFSPNINVPLSTFKSLFNRKMESLILMEEELPVFTDTNWKKTHIMLSTIQRYFPLNKTVSFSFSCINIHQFNYLARLINLQGFPRVAFTFVIPSKPSDQEITAFGELIEKIPPGTPVTLTVVSVTPQIAPIIEKFVTQPLFDPSLFKLTMYRIELAALPLMPSIIERFPLDFTLVFGTLSSICLKQIIQPDQTLLLTLKIECFPNLSLDSKEMQIIIPFLFSLLNQEKTIHLMIKDNFSNLIPAFIELINHPSFNRNRFQLTFIDSLAIPVLYPIIQQGAFKEISCENKAFHVEREENRIIITINTPDPSYFIQIYSNLPRDLQIVSEIKGIPVGIVEYILFLQAELHRFTFKFNEIATEDLPQLFPIMRLGAFESIKGKDIKITRCDEGIHLHYNLNTDDEVYLANLLDALPQNLKICVNLNEIGPKIATLINSIALQQGNENNRVKFIVFEASLQNLPLLSACVEFDHLIQFNSTRFGRMRCNSAFFNGCLSLSLEGDTFAPNADLLSLMQSAKKLNLMIDIPCTRAEIDILNLDNIKKVIIQGQEVINNLN